MLPSVTQVSVFGSRVPGSLRQATAEALTRNLLVRYGAGEVGSISSATPDQHDDYPEGVGSPIPSAAVEIVDGAGRLLPPGEVGEVRVKSSARPSDMSVTPPSQAHSSKAGSIRAIFCPVTEMGLLFFTVGPTRS